MPLTFSFNFVFLNVSANKDCNINKMSHLFHVIARVLLLGIKLVLLSALNCTIIQLENKHIIQIEWF